MHLYHQAKLAGSNVRKVTKSLFKFRKCVPLFMRVMCTHWPTDCILISH